MTTKRLVRETLEALEVYLLLDDSDEPEDVKEAALCVFLEAFKTLKTPPLRSPKDVRLTQKDYDQVETFWERMRARGAESSFQAFLGVPRFLFVQLCAEIKPRLPQYCHDIKRRGQPTKLDYVDVLALCLKYTRIGHPNFMEELGVAFGRNEAVLYRALNHGMDALLKVLISLPDADIRYPTLQEAKKQWAGMKKQYGIPPWDPRILMVLSGDGTFASMTSPSDKDEQRLHKGHKGVGFNSVFIMDGSGCFVDAVWGMEGCYSDSRIAKVLLRRHWSASINPHRLGMILDNGWSSIKDFSGGHPGEPPMRIRPLRNGDAIPKSLETYVEKCSVKATIYRQQNEHGNGTLKRCYPCVIRPRLIRQRPVYVRDVEVCVRLNNLR